VTRLRLIYSAIIIAGILCLVWLDFRLGTEVANGGWGCPGIVLLVSILVVGPLAANEVLHFDPHLGQRRIRPWAVYSGTCVIILFAAIPMLYQDYSAHCPIGRLGWLAFGVAAATGIAFVSQMIGYKAGDRVIDDIGRTLLIAIYAGLFLAFWLPIRFGYNNAWGMVALLSLFVTVKMSDAAAWAVGKRFGRHKLAPQLSPGKTLEGLAGGLLGGYLGAVTVFYLVAPQITGQSTSANGWTILLFSLLVTAAGVVGDLAESLLKRDGGVKNSSRWLPGLGGVTDLVDSLLVSGPVVLAFWNSGMLAPVWPAASG
jgi:phosphatidate cytidylyltransferase